MLLWLFADVYFFNAVTTLTANPAAHWAYWSIDILIVIGVVFTMLVRSRGGAPRAISWVMALMLLSAVPKIVGTPVLLIEDIVRAFNGFPPRTAWVSELALIIAAVPFLGLVFGLTKGRHHYVVHKHTLYFADLPDAFDGFTLTQLSDIHAGSFTSETGVNKGIEMVNAQHSDVILFTGDLVKQQSLRNDALDPLLQQTTGAYG